MLAFRVSESAGLMRILVLGHAGDSLPPGVVCTDKEIEVRQIQAEKKFWKLATLAGAVVIVASLAGYLDRACDARPGYERFWRGFSKLQVLCEAYEDGEVAGCRRGVPIDMAVGYAMDYEQAKKDMARNCDMWAT